MSGPKTLLPELLPTPRPQSAETPRERVAARARAMLERLSGLKAAAGAAVLAAHCGYTVVDPVPPPPAQCATKADPFAGFAISGSAFPVADGGGSDASFLLLGSAIGYQVGAVRVTAGGTLISFDDESSTSLTEVSISIHADGSGAPIDFEIDLGCGGAMTTKHYRATATGNNGYTVVDLG